MNTLSIVSEALIEKGLLSDPLLSIQSVSGGCINDCFYLSNQKNQVFVKVNQSEKFPGMFQQEQKGLALLRDSGTLRVPKRVDLFEKYGNAYLVLEWIKKGQPQKDFWKDFGQRLAQLHQCSQDSFGLDHDNFIGSLPQKNQLTDDWSTFFLECRLIPQIELGLKHQWASSKLFKHAEAIASIIEDEFPVEQPALLHGDLWSGNYLIDEKGAPVVMDPAVYYGHREIEIAFTQLFGGYDQRFYEYYNDQYPLQSDFKKRLNILQLYPLLVHANLFGGHYIHQCIGILKRY